MNFDRNTIIGFVLLAIIFFGFFWYNNQEQLKYQKAKAEKARQDSIARAQQAKNNPPPPVRKDSAGNPTPQISADSAHPFFSNLQGAEKLTTIGTPLMNVVFTNKGGQPKYVELKKFKAPDSSLVKLAATNFDKIEYPVITGNNKTDSITSFYFSGGESQKNADGSETVSFTLQSADGRSITHQYVVKPDNYMIDFNVLVNGSNQLFSNNTVYFNWKNSARQLQGDLSYERAQSRICFNLDNDYDYYQITSRTEKEFNDPVKWVSVKQQFFNTALVARQGSFSSGRVQWTAPGSGNTIVNSTTTLNYALTGAQANIPLGIYYGPNDYKTLKQYGNDMEDMVDLGSGMFAFVKYINRWIIIPIFDLLSTLTSNYGIVILLLTLFIRLLTSPLMYPGYVTSAKMKILRPELEQLKAKYPDQQQYAMEQMKFTREAGVNQFAGCLPGLLQIPIFFALYSFFNSSVALRGQGFLWSDDLSQYDSIAQLPFSIPFYGDHVSLFTITAVVTSFLISLYSMSNMSPDQSNPVLKYMPYFFPVILLFIFNSLPAGLTWYYTVSNIITLILQFVIQNYIINHDKLIAKIEANRKKPKKQNKWQERIAQMQEQQKQMKEAQNKNRR